MVRALLAPVSMCVLLSACIIERQQPPPPPPPTAPTPAHEAKAAPPPPTRPTLAQPSANGRPTSAIGREDGFWIWRTNNAQWHVRTTSPGKARHYAGAISAKGTDIKVANSVRPEAGDKIQLNAGKIDFEVNTNGGIDGLDFQTTNPDACVVFDLTVDAEQVPQRIMVGQQEAHPQAARFTACP